MNKITFTNFLENMRVEIIDYFHLIQLKDKYGHLWDIQKISIDLQKTVLVLGNDGTSNYDTCTIYDGIFLANGINDLDEYEVVWKEQSND